MTEKILVVENEDHLRQLYRMELEEEGYQVVTAADGQTALKRFTEVPIDLVVLDLKLPDGAGLDYLQNLVDINRDVKVVINTSYFMYKMDFHSWAADAYLIKSSDLTELKHTIDEVLHDH